MTQFQFSDFFANLLHTTCGVKLTPPHSPSVSWFPSTPAGIRLISSKCEFVSSLVSIHSYLKWLSPYFYVTPPVTKACPIHNSVLKTILSEQNKISASLKGVEFWWIYHLFLKQEMQEKSFEENPQMKINSFQKQKHGYLFHS